MENQTRHLQSVVLEIANQVKEICERHQLRYSLDGGTLLGAVRHKGFIPWDDDFDISMPREDFEKFLIFAKAELDTEKFFLQTGSTENYYAFSFAKIQLVGTRILESFSEDVPIHHGIFVDIFPYDKLPSSGGTKKIFLVMNHLLKNLIWVKCGYGSKQKKRVLKYSLFWVASKPLSISFLKKKRYALITKFSDSATTMCFTSDYPDVRVDIREYDNMPRLQFERKAFTAYNDADRYLTDHYGDYMRIPDKEHQVTHTTRHIDFGSY